MVDEKEIEKDLKKDESQEESIDPSVEKELNEMGYIWNRIMTKFQKDNICFECKKSLKGKKVSIIEANTKDKGMIVFLSICQSCLNKMIEKNKGEVKDGRK